MTPATLDHKNSQVCIIWLFQHQNRNWLCLLFYALWGFHRPTCSIRSMKSMKSIKFTWATGFMLLKWLWATNILWANKWFLFVNETLAWQFGGIAKHIVPLFVIVSKIFTTYEIQKHLSTVHKDGCLNADKMAVKLGTNKNSNGWLPGMVPKGWWLWSKFKNPCRVSTEPFQGPSIKYIGHIFRDFCLPIYLTTYIC